MLVERGMLGRRAYQENPLRHEYVLTDKGKSFYPVIVSLMTYGDRWLADKMGPPIILEHMNCGKRLMPVLVCDQCHEALELNDIRFYEQLPCENRDRRSTASN